MRLIEYRIISIFTIFVLIDECITGTVHPYGFTPITNSIANNNQNSNYNFTFTTDTSVPIGGTVVITFPSQYTSGLGLPTTPICSLPCTSNGQSVTFQLTSVLVKQRVTNVVVNGILNPTKRGGTGNFQIQTYQGVNLLDENLVFAVIGISDDIGTLTSTLVSLDSESLSEAGIDANYTFVFQVNNMIPWNSFFLFTITDTGFTYTNNPVCESISVNGQSIQGTFTCQAIGRDIKVTGLEADIPSGTYVGIKILLTNPKVSGTTSTFNMAIFKIGTNIIWNQKLSVSGVTITPGPVDNIALTPVVSSIIQAMGKYQDYTLTFEPYNKLTTGCVITVEFPTTFQNAQNKPALAYIVSGLENLNEDNPVGLYIDSSSNTITLSNFAPYLSTAPIVLYLRMINPLNSGPTTAVKIKTWTDYLLQLEIDEDITTGITYISTTKSPTTCTVAPNPSYTHPITSEVMGIADQSAFSLTFTIKPAVTIPMSGLIKVIIPDGIDIATTITTANCKIWSRTGSNYLASPSCTVTDRTFTLQLLASETFPLGCTTCSFQITNNALISPKYNGSYLLDVTTYMNDGTTVLESCSAYIRFNANQYPTSTPPISVINNEQGKRTLVIASFRTILPIPSGARQKSALDSQGRLEFEFYTSNTPCFANDLGTGLANGATFPCQPIAGLVPIDGISLNCTFYQGTSSNNPTIRVTNFLAIPANELITIHFPNILLPANSPIIVYAKAINLKNRIYTELNSVRYSITTVAFSTPPTTTNTASSYVFSSTQVSTTTSITFNAGLPSNIPTGSNIIVAFPFYDIGWLPSSGVTCAIAKAPVQCQIYPGVDWILIQATSTISSATQNSWTFTNLQVPTYANQQLTGIVIRVISSTTFAETLVINQASFPTPTVPTLLTSVIIAPVKGKGYVNAPYTFQFKSLNTIKAGSMILITFPTGYNLLSSTPAVTFSSPQLTSISNSLPIQFNPINIHQLQISNFATIAAQTTFVIEVSGLKNPISGTISTGWDIVVTYLGYQVTKDLSFDSFAYTTAFTTGQIIFNSITATPSNANQYADYYIYFTPRTEIPSGGTIQIVFPVAQYKVLPSPPVCIVSGGITTFSSCTLQGTTIVIIMNAVYSAGGITLKIKNILNPDLGTTDPFVINTYYDGVNLDTTDTTSTIGRTVSITSKSASISVDSIDFYPKNEGEPATYTFIFYLSNYLTTNMQILIIFPNVYDKNLGSNVYCDSTTGLAGTISCSIQDKIATITGFQTYVPSSDKPITINIYKVTNPNKQSSTGQFQIATQVIGTNLYIDFTDSAGTLSILSAPGWSTLYNITADNYYSRLGANYRINFTSNVLIPKTSSDGAIFVDFSNQFQLSDGVLSCDTNNTDFAAVLVCKTVSNRVTITGHTQGFTGNLGFYLRLVNNPEDPVIAGGVYIKTYDGTNQVILERSYDNLDPFTFIFAYPGPLIYVNKDQDIVVARGTRSPIVYFTLDYPCALNLTIKPTLPGFSVVPYDIEISLGQIQSPFVVSVPEEFVLGSYYIYWTTIGDLVPAYYTPIRKTRVNVTSETVISILVPDVYDIPYGGSSLFSSFVLPYAPDIDLELSLNFLLSYPGITLNTTSASFDAGQLTSSFIVYSSNNSNITGGVVVSGGTLVITKSGINSDIYDLPQAYIVFNVISADFTKPYFKNIDVTNILQTQVTITLNTGDTCIAYYMIALDLTDPPTISQMLEADPTNFSVNSIVFGNVLIPLPNNITNINITGLVAQTPYIFYAYLLSRGGQYSDLTNITFQTSDRYPASEFGLKFNQAYLSPADKIDIIEAVAFTLSLNTSKVCERKYIIPGSSLSSRILEDDDVDGIIVNGTLHNSRNLQIPVATIIYLQIISIPESPVYPSPTVMALSLNQRKQQLLARMSNFDETYTIPAADFVSYVPTFIDPPNLVAHDITWAAFSTILDNYGMLYAVCVEKANDTRKPTAYQIYQGLNGSNFVVNSASAEIPQPGLNFTVNVSGLTPLTDYNAYIIGGSAHPGYPDLMIDDDVVVISFTTNPAPISARLNINEGENLKIYKLFMIYTFIMIVMIIL